MSDDDDISKQARLILDSVAFELHALKHPVEALTIEAASSAAGVSASTVTSSVRGIDEFRQRTLAHLLSQFQSSPSAEVWEATQNSIVRKYKLLPALAIFLDAVSHQLAADPVLPFVIGTAGPAAMERDQVEHAIRSFNQGFAPLLITVAAAAGLDLRQHAQNPALHRTLWIAACAAAVEPILRGDQCSTSEDRTITFAEGLQFVLEGLQSSPPVEPLTPATEIQTRPKRSASLQRAIETGAELLLQGRLKPSVDLTVAEICRRSGVGFSAFYRQFQTLAEFNRVAIGEAGRKARAANIASFNQDLEQVALLTAPDWDTLVPSLVELYIQASDLDRIDRVEAPLWPWLNTQPATQSLLEFLEMAIAHRIPAYQFVADLAGREFVPNDVHRFAWTVSCIGTAGNMERNRLDPNSKERELATSILGKLMGRALQTMSRPQGGKHV